ncbi:MAG: amidohydrolase family protein [Opitutaceae bacterium]
MPVIDAHVHLYPPELNRDPAGWATAHREPHWATLCARKRKNGRPVQAFPSLEELLRTMDAVGVDRAVLLGWYWENHETCVLQNRFYAACGRAHPDRLSAFATVHPAAGEAALAEIRRAHDAGLVGLGELSPHSQHVAVDDPRWLAVLMLAGELGLPVNLHVTDPSPATGNYPGRVETPLADFTLLAQAFSKVNFILAHWGGCGWRHGVRLPGNVWFDTAASPLLYEPAVFDEGVTACGADRVLWGTDYPLDLYPRDEGKETMRGFLAEARAALPAAVAGNVLGGNASRLLRLASGA